MAALAGSADTAIILHKISPLLNAHPRWDQCSANAARSSSSSQRDTVFNIAHKVWCGEDASTYHRTGLRGYWNLLYIGVCPFINMDQMSRG